MKKLFLVLIILGSFFSCNDRLEELNRPKKSAASVPANALFNNGLRNLADLMASSDVNTNVFRLYAQYWAQTTYPDESQYNMVGREIPDNFWTLAYRDVLKDLDEASLVLDETWEQLGLDEATRDNQHAMINISKQYMYSVLVDIFGAIPYEESLNDEILLPAYQPGEEVYDLIIASLDESIAALNTDAGGFEVDLLYDGDVEKWVKFANSLKLRLALNLADVNPSKASTMISQAIADDMLILTNDDNASFIFEASPPNTNPVWEDLVQSGRQDYVISNTLADHMNALGDPRIAIYGQSVDGEYIGGEYGTGNSYSGNSPAGEIFHAPDLPGVLIDAAEVNFLLAEAAAHGINVPETAETYYNTAITQSMMWWDMLDPNVEITDLEIAAYLLQPSVAYATAAGDWNQKIGTQEWIHLYNRGFEGWTAWRRLDFTGFNVPEGLTEADIPRRLIFPIEEATLNPSNLDAAIGLIDGGDVAGAQVFWDVN